MLFTGTRCLKDTNNTNNNTQNKLKLMMKTKFFYSKVMLLMLAMILSAQGLWAQKTDPDLIISLGTEFTSVPVGQANFTKPDVSLKTYTDNTKTVVKETISDEGIEKLRDHCRETRNDEYILMPKQKSI